MDDAARVLSRAGCEGAAEMKKYLIAIGFLAAIGSDAMAEIYKWKDTSGQWQYSETPPKNRIVGATDIQTEYSTAPKFVPKPVRKEREPEGPQMISIENSKSKSGACDTASNGYLSNHGAAGDAVQDWQWKKCRGMK
jgi:hypothetical protein